MLSAQTEHYNTAVCCIEMAAAETCLSKDLSVFPISSPNQAFALDCKCGIWLRLAL